jgi:hypothetical protein
MKRIKQHRRNYILNREREEEHQEKRNRTAGKHIKIKVTEKQ